MGNRQSTFEKAIQVKLTRGEVVFLNRTIGMRINKKLVEIMTQKPIERK